MSTTRGRCPWCKGEVATDDEEKRTSHTVPLCDGYKEFLSRGKVKPAGVDVLDSQGRVVSRKVPS